MNRNNQNSISLKGIFKILAGIAVLILLFGRYNGSRIHLAGRYYMEYYFPNDNGIAYQLSDGRLMSVVKSHIKSVVIQDSVLFIKKQDADAVLSFQIDMRKSIDFIQK